MKRFALTALAVGLLSLSLGACEKGPAEKAGEKLDDVVEDIRHGDESTLEKAGRKTDEAIEDAKEKLEDDE